MIASPPSFYPDNQYTAKSRYPSVKWRTVMALPEPERRGQHRWRVIRPVSVEVAHDFQRHRVVQERPAGIIVEQGLGVEPELQLAES